MSKGCEMCNRTGVVFKPGMPGLDDKDTCPECGGRGIVESATVPAGKRDATADLAMCDAATPGPWISSSVVIREEILPGEGGHLIAACNQYTLEKSRANAKFIAVSREALPYWLREVERLRGVAEANLAMSADLIAMEGTIKELRHELARSRDAHGKAELELARLRTTLASIEEYGTEEINAGIELRQEVARLHKIIADATGHSKDGDGVDLLCKALYGRPGQVPDWLGGSEARMLYDAVEEIEELRSEADALDRLRGWRDAAPGRWFNLENDIGCPEALALGELPDAAHLPSCLVVIGCDDEPHTEDNPASFTEVVEAALARWSDLYGEEQP